MIINNTNDLATYFGTTLDHLERDIYKYTECGAWITWTDSSVSIGSIVEGSDAEFSETFQFPVDSDEIDNWMEELEELCDEAWHEANDWEEEERKWLKRNRLSKSNPGKVAFLSPWTAMRNITHTGYMRFLISRVRMVGGKAKSCLKSMQT